MGADGEKRWTRSVKLGALGEQGDGKKTRVSLVSWLLDLKEIRG